MEDEDRRIAAMRAYGNVGNFAVRSSDQSGSVHRFTFTSARRARHFVRRRSAAFPNTKFTLAQ